MIRFEVLGTPAPKGSARAFMTRGPNPRAFVVNSGSKQNEAKLRSWDQAVRLAAAEAARLYGVDPAAPAYVETAIRVIINFRLARPGSHWGKKGLRPSAPPYPIVKPDIDKLTRATLDSMKGALYDDDARICEKIVTKTYAAPGEEGANIIVEPVDYQPPPVDSGPVLPGVEE